MAHDDNNIDDIKEKLKKKRQNAEYQGYTLKSALSKDNEQAKPAKEQEPKSDVNKAEAKKGSQKVPDDKKKSDGDLSLQIEHYKDFDDEQSDVKKTDDKEKKTGQKEKSAKKNRKKQEKRNTPKQKKKKFEFKRVHMYIALIVLLVLFLAALLWYVFSSASDVKEINFEGNSLVSEAELEERIGFSTGDKMFSISAGKAEENVELLPVIEDVSVSRDWPNGITVNVNEYKAIAYINSDTLYFPVLENSRIQRGYPTAPRNAPIIYNFEGEEFDALVEALNNIEVDILESISEIYFRPTDNSMRRIHVFMNDGQEIVADYETFSEKMNYYIGIRQEIGDESEGIIDMEVGTSYLPYDSADAREIKDNIYNEPTQAGYIEDINGALEGVRSSLGSIDSTAEE